jgi:hypothetical protein
LISINSPYPRPTARCVQKLVNEQILNILSVVPHRRVATSSLISLTENEHKGSIQMGYAVLDTYPRLMESHCLSLFVVLELYGAFVTTGRMPADWIIKAIDISGNSIFGLAA